MGLFDLMMVDAVTITPKGAKTADGRHAYDGTAVTTLGRVVDKSGLLRSEGGQDVTYDRVVYLKSGETVAAGDKIAYNSTDHEVMELRAVDQTVSGVLDHYKAMVKRLAA